MALCCNALCVIGSNDMPCPAPPCYAKLFIIVLFCLSCHVDVVTVHFFPPCHVMSCHCTLLPAMPCHCTLLLPMPCHGVSDMSDSPPCICSSVFTAGKSGCFLRQKPQHAAEQHSCFIVSFFVHFTANHVF